MLRTSNGSSTVPLCFKFKNECKGTLQFLVVHKHHTEHHWDMLNTSVTMYVLLAAQAPGSPKVISRSCLSAEQTPRSHLSLQLTALQGSATREKKK